MYVWGMEMRNNMISVKTIDNELVFTLFTNSSSYQMKADKYGVLLHLYYGRPIINGDNLSDLIFLSDMGFSGNPPCAGKDRTYSLDTLPQEVSGFGIGDYRDSMVSLLHDDGSRAAEFRYDSFEIVDSSYKIDGMPALYDTSVTKGETLIITMREAASDIVLKLYYGVYEKENVITRAAKIINKGTRRVFVEKLLSMNMDMMFFDPDMIYFTGRHAFERAPERVPVKHAKVEIGSVRGTSSHQYNPAFILCDHDTNEEQGNCYGFCLAYSGNFVGAAQKDQKNQVRVQMGIHPEGFHYLLEQDEELMTPQVIMSFSGSGLSTLSQQYHDILRENMCRGKYKHEKRPVLINNWEATYFDFDREKLHDIAQQASELGIEMLVLDDGWFGKRDDDFSGLGDWFVNEKKLGGSLKEVGERVNAMGMKFGLWFEPEMISEDSDLYREHPEWAVAIPNREPNRGRYQLTLDMSRADVRDYLLEKMTDILNNAPIIYVKWDLNRSICDMYSYASAQERSGELYHKYVLGVYDLLERLLERFPDLLLEGCSGGGGRFDAGMLYYSPQIWCSDNTDAINRLSIQYGTSFFYPISSFGSHVSACPNHQTGRSVPFQTRGDVAMSGSFGYELDLGKISEEEKEQVKEQVAQFHKLYDLTHEGDYYRLTPLENGDCMAWAFVAKDKKRAALTIVKTQSEGNPLPTHVYMKGLLRNRQYRCTLKNDMSVIKTGAAFINAGITIPWIMMQYESVMVLFEEI